MDRRDFLRLGGFAAAGVALAGHHAAASGPNAVYVADEALLSAVVGFSIHRGVLACGARRGSRLPPGRFPS